MDRSGSIHDPGHHLFYTTRRPRTVPSSETLSVSIKTGGRDRRSSLLHRTHLRPLTPPLSLVTAIQSFPTPGYTPFLFLGPEAIGWVDSCHAERVRVGLDVSPSVRSPGVRFQFRPVVLFFRVSGSRPTGPDRDWRDTEVKGEDTLPVLLSWFIPSNRAPDWLYCAQAVCHS